MGNTGDSRRDRPGGLAGWLLARWANRNTVKRRLIVVDRISLGPRQTLSLIEADGRRILVANSAAGASFHELVGGRPPTNANLRRASW